MRGHSAPITRLAISSGRQLLYSASLDASIRIWRLPSIHVNTYAPFNSLHLLTFVGHSDAVWDLILLRNETVLVSSGADGKVIVWDVNSLTTGAPGGLKLSWGYNGTGQDQDAPIAITALESIKTDLKAIAVAYRNAVIKLFDVDTGKALQKLKFFLNNNGKILGTLFFLHC